MHPGQRVLAKFAAQSLKTYPALRDFVEKERPDWLQALMPRRINAPSDYWPQKVLALATIQAAISNQLMKDAGLKLDLTFGAVASARYRRHAGALSARRPADCERAI